MTEIVTIQKYQNALYSLQHEKDSIVCAINSNLRGKTVIINRGRFKNCRAVILNYCFDAGNEYLHLYVISVRKTEVIELEYCKMQ